jgi:uncharacterized membrane protein
MTDKLEALVAGASTLQLRRLVSLAADGPVSVENIIPVLAEPRELALRLSGIGQPAGADGTALVATVLDERASLDDLRSVHRAARSLIEKAEGPVERAAAELLYHAAVAAAFARHRAGIAERPIEQRRDLYAGLASQLGSGPLAQLFALAVDKSTNGSPP